MEELKKDFDTVLEYLKNQDDNTIIQYHNEYCDRNNYAEDEIFNNDDEFFEMYFSDTFSAIRATQYGNYSYSDNYVVFNGQANLDTSNKPTDFIDYDALASDAMDNPEEYEIEFIDPLDLDDEDLFEYLKEEGHIVHNENLEDYTREELEELL